MLRYWAPSFSAAKLFDPSMGMLCFARDKEIEAEALQDKRIRVTRSQGNERQSRLLGLFLGLSYFVLTVLTILLNPEADL
jgi:hypothetical protein